MRAAVIVGEEVINVIEVESVDQQQDLAAIGAIPGDAILVETEEAGPGWTYVEGEFVAPPPPEPEVMPGQEEEG
jgi:hypothetical protein